MAKKLYTTVYNPAGFHSDIATRQNQSLAALQNDMGVPRGWRDDRAGWRKKLNDFDASARPGDILISDQVVIFRQRPSR